jgi:putative restriction endonuclease
MPRFPKTAMRDIISDALTQSGYVVKSQGGSHPFRYKIQATTDEELLVYVWNVTHGGKNRADDEYRIQVTGPSGLKHDKGVKTLLLGVAVEPASQLLLVGFDASKHSTFGSSPSIQVHTPTLLKAEREGMAAETKELARGDSEVVFAFRPEHLGDYLRSVFPAYHEKQTQISRGESKQLHGFDFTKPDLTEKDISASVPEERKRALITASMWVRDQNFRSRVLHVYGYKCAFCGLQANLVQAGHIDGVAKKGTDEVKNGLAMCAIHHTAFDRGLLAVREDFVIVKNTTMDKALRKAGLDGGLDDFYNVARVGQTIYLPNDAKYHPDAKLLKKNCDGKGAQHFSA